MLQTDNKLFLINKNIQLINKYLDDVPQEQVKRLFENLADTFVFYDISQNKIRQIIRAGTIQSALGTELAELYAITNAILFHLKYKIKDRYRYARETDYNRNSAERL